jgi:hypothetical protein
MNKIAVLAEQQFFFNRIFFSLQNQITLDGILVFFGAKQRPPNPIVLHPRVRTDGPDPVP